MWARRSPVSRTELPSDLDHRLAGAADADELEDVAVALALDRLADRAHDGLRAAGPQRRAQVDGVVVGQAGVEGAGRRQPHAVAGVAEVLGHGRDDPDDVVAPIEPPV